MTVAELWDTERLLALNYVPKARRPAMLALWQLDEALGRIVATTTEPMIGQMRLTWWYEKLCGLNARTRISEPLLGRLRDDVLPCDITGEQLAALIEGWEALLEPLPLDEATLAVFAEKRGGALFALSATLLDAKVEAMTGQAWALVDFAARCSDAVTAERALKIARERSPVATRRPKSLRILARFAHAKLRRSGVPISKPLSRLDFLRAILG